MKKIQKKDWFNIIPGLKNPDTYNGGEELDLIVQRLALIREHTVELYKMLSRLPLEKFQRYMGPFILHNKVGEGDIPGDPKNLDRDAKDTIDAVLKYYGDKTAQWLSDLTHKEDPWKNARVGLGDGDRGHNEISLAAMEEYYSSLKPDGEEEE